MDSIDFETIAGLAAAPIVPANDRNSKHLVEQSAAKQPLVQREESVLIVDDDPNQLDRLRGYLEEDGFGNVLSVEAAEEAVGKIRQHQPDIVMLDWSMSHGGGLEVLQEVRGDERICDTLMIILNESTAPESRAQAIEFGATDCLTKPFLPTELRFRIERALGQSKTVKQLAELSGQLELKVKARTEELLNSRQEAIRCLARAVEYRDDDTGHHVTRIGRYSAIIASELGFPKAAVELIEQAAQLHDIGKVGVPESILHKPGRLDSVESARMKKHCAIGRRIIIAPLEADCDTNRLRRKSDEKNDFEIHSPVLRMAALIAESHHEKWDGTGYPRGLKGEDIPLAGRIVAVADVFDALASKRPYKGAFPIEKCLSILMDGRGKHFDPRVLDAFLARKDEILLVQRQFNSPTESTLTNRTTGQ